MKIILFDILEKSKRCLIIENDINSFGECIYIYINEKILYDKSFLSKIKCRLYEKYIKGIFSSKKFKEDKYIYILSKQLEKNTALKNKLISLLDDKFYETKNINTITKNSIKYISHYNNEFKILVIVSEKIEMSILLSYLEKFRIVDFLYFGTPDTEFKKNINNINKEYGTTVSFIKSKDITSYDVYIFFGSLSLSGYVINHKAVTLDLTSSDNDIYSNEYKIYMKYENEIKNKENYSKTKLGGLISTYLTDSV